MRTAPAPSLLHVLPLKRPGPALAAADASIAPGSASDVGRQAADFVFTGDSLLALPRGEAANEHCESARSRVGNEFAMSDTSRSECARMGGELGNAHCGGGAGAVQAGVESAAASQYLVVKAAHKWN